MRSRSTAASAQNGDPLKLVLLGNPKSYTLFVGKGSVPVLLAIDLVLLNNVRPHTAQQARNLLWKFGRKRFTSCHTIGLWRPAIFVCFPPWRSTDPDIGSSAMKLPSSGRRNRNITICASGSDKLSHTVTRTSNIKGTMVKKNGVSVTLYCILSVSCIKILTLIYGCSKLTLWSSSFIAYWFRDSPAGWIFNNRTLCPRCIFEFCIYLRTNSDLYCLHHKLNGFDNRDEKCLLRGTNWVFK